MQGTQRRLLREVPVLRGYLAATTASAALVAAAVIAQASLLAGILAAGFAGSRTAISLAGPLAALAGVVGARAGLAWLQGVLAQRAAASLEDRLRGRLLARSQRIGAAGLARWRGGELAALITRGLDTLGPYVTGYLPKLMAAAVVPLAVIARLAVADWPSAVIVGLTLPLIPVFAALVGWHTRTRTARQWALLSRLGGHFRDVVAGLPTLRAFGRARPQAAVVARMADAHRTATMRTLRVAFLSSLVLELVATLSVALVAVPAGLRLMAGDIDLRTALLVLFLAPEAYLPLRAAGAAFHDSMEGVAVADRAFAVLDTEAEGPAPGARAAPNPGVAGLALDGVTARYPGREAPALDGVSLHVEPGERVALVGPSGAGKSTLLALALGFLDPQAGRVRAGDADLAALDLDDWRRHLAWVPQRPHLFAGSVTDNIRLGQEDAPMSEVREAARAAAADAFIAELPRGYDTALGERGAGLSAGQRQRIALARAFLRDAPLLLLDEPTAHLDPYSEAAVAEASARLMAGRTAIVVAHRRALLPQATRVVRLSGGQTAGLDRPQDAPPDRAEPARSPIPSTNLTVTG